MRQRRIKNLEERIENLKDYEIENPEELKGKWREHFAKEGRDREKLYLEIGCGKGQFITELAKKNQDANYIAIEVQPSVWVLAVEKAKEDEIKNVAFLNLHIKDVTQYFEEGELDGIYLNFSDPWHKARHAKRRLTHRNFLTKYFQVLNEDGFVKVKTDNDNLFEFTVEEVTDLGLQVKEITRDLHKSEFAEDNTMTEYEEKFSSRGKNINYIMIKRR